MDAEDIITHMINEGGHAGVVPKDAGEEEEEEED
jgi:hypothetical protein